MASTKKRNSSNKVERVHAGLSAPPANGISKDPLTAERTTPQRPMEDSRRRSDASATPELQWKKKTSAIAQTTLPVWLNMTVMIMLIFGGCCANVFALEAIVKDEPESGTLITFTQFLITAIFTIPPFVSPSAGPTAFFLKPRSIPLRSWTIYTVFFMTVNLLNNFAFAYKISVPLHIILRSAGPVATMVVGYLYNGKRYTPIQVLAVLLLTIGVVTSAMADAQAHGKSITITSEASSLTGFLIGSGILTLAMILSAFQGVYADSLYEKYGRSHWREALFYSHALSLPILLLNYGSLHAQYDTLASSPPISPTWTKFSTGPTTMLPLLTPLLSHVPSKIIYLLLNALTQYLCIRGVHLLSAQSSSLTVTIVLNIRKLVSLLLSIYLFGNKLSLGVLVGAVVVFVGGGVYGAEGARLGRLRKDKGKASKKTQ